MDRTYRGFIAGTIAAIYMNIINIVFYRFELVEIRFIDWGGLTMLGIRPESSLEIMFGLMVHILWTGSLGIIFSFLVPKITSRGVLFKGGLYAFFVTFLFKVIANLFKIPVISKIPVKTNLINTLIAFSWGLLLVQILKYFERDMKD